MIIAVGSMNRTKGEAVHRAIYGESHVQCYPAFVSDEIRAYNILSHVRDQPFGMDETMRGAINRASGAFTEGKDDGDCRFGVGIEAGLLEIPLLVHPDGSPRYEEKTICTIYDGDTYLFGSSAGFEHPKAVIDCVLQEHVDISEAYKRCGFTDSPKIGEEHGCVHLLTQARVQRSQEIADAVRRALIPFENVEMYR
ncbi:DUF84 family protein [Candidatus Woesearchaeota archaeon]|nr:DUF84 family protein [Candidatus Woesearchaeota archaeon]